MSMVDGGDKKTAASCMEVNQLLIEVRKTSGDRRRHQRVPGNGASMVLLINGSSVAVAVVRDLSLSGVSLVGAFELPPDQDVELDLPNGSGTVLGRVVRCKGGILVLVFRQDQATKERVSAAIDLISRQTIPA